jgi:hypothetical protein
MQPSPDAVALYSFRVWSYKQGELVSLFIHLGDRLGLYRALADLGRVTAAELAEATGLHERWVLEWLRGNAAADLLVSADGEHFELPAEAVPVLVDDEQSLAFAGAAFGAPFDATMVDDLADAFRTGIGLPYDRQGPCGAHRTERLLGPWTRFALVPKVIPALADVTDKLTAGARVADVGCGPAWRSPRWRGHPASTFDGFDLAPALDRRRVAAGLDNVTLLQRGESLPAGRDCDLILTFDCIRRLDPPRPSAPCAAHAHGVARQDIRSSGSWELDRQNPLLR